MYPEKSLLLSRYLGFGKYFLIVLGVIINLLARQIKADNISQVLEALANSPSRISVQSSPAMI